MPDSLQLEIVLTDEGPGAQAPPPPRPPAPSPSPRPIQEAQPTRAPGAEAEEPAAREEEAAREVRRFRTRLESAREEPSEPSPGAPETPQTPAAPEPAFDPEAEARKQLEREDQREQVKAAFDRLRPPEVEAAFDPEAEARKRLEREGQQAQVQEAYERLKPAAPEEAAGGGAGAGDIASFLGKQFGGEALGGALGDLGAAAELGPAAIIPVALDVAGKQLASQFDRIGADAKQLGDVFVSLGQNNNLAGLTKAADMAAEGLGKIPIVGQVLESGIKAVTSTFTAANAVVESFVERGRELAGYSAELAGADARAEVKSLLEDIKEANDLGPDLARMTDLQSELSAELREALLPLKKFAIEVLNKVMELLIEWLPYVRGAFDALIVATEQSAESISAAVHLDFAGAVAHLVLLRGAVDAFRNGVEDARHKDEAEKGDLFAKQLEMLQQAVTEVPMGFDPVLAGRAEP